MVEKKKKIHYAWFILIGCCCIFAASMALTMSVAGVYIGPMAAKLGIGPGDVALWLGITGPPMVIAAPLWGRAYQTISVNIVITIGALLEVIAILIFAFATELWHLLAAGILIGISIPAVFALATPTLISNWFSEKYRGKMLGIAAAFSGVGTFVWAPLFTALVLNAGITTAYLVNAALATVLILPFSIFVFKLKPEDKGLKPYGFDAESATAKKDDLEAQSGAKISTAFKSIGFWAVMVGMMFVTIGMGYNSNQPGMAGEFLTGQMDAGAAAMIGATMISVAAVGNIIGKIAFGFIVDKLGIRVAFIAFLILFAISFLIWMLLHNPAPLLVGAFFFGTHNALVSVGWPLLIRKLFGAKNYTQILSVIGMPASIIGGIGSSIVAYFYQIGGSYQGSLYLGIACVAIIAVVALIGLSQIGKVPFDDKVTK